MKRNLLGSILAIFLIITLSAAAGAALKPEIQPGGIKTFRGGRLEYQHGIPLLRLTGSHYQMGLQYGVLMREEIKDILAEIDQYYQGIKEGLPFYLHPYFNYNFNKKVNELSEYIPERYQEELKGMAKGAGIPYQRLVFAAVAPEIMSSGCSSILSSNKKGLILGRNLDFSPSFLGKYPVIVEYNPEEGNSFTSVGIIGLPGVLTGFNEKGIMLSVNVTNFFPEKESSDPPLGFMTRKVLNKASTIEEVDKLLTSYQSHQGWIITVGSSQEKQGAAYELAGKTVARRPLADRGYVISTNYYRADKTYHKYNTLLDATDPGNVARYQSIENNLSQRSIKSVDSILQILASTNFYHYQDFIGSGFVVNRDASLQTIVIDPANKKLYFSSATSFSPYARLFSYDLESRELEVYREENHQFRQQYAELIDWNQKINKRLKAQDYQGAVEAYDFSRELTLYQVMVLHSIWNEDHQLVDNDRLLTAINKKLREYKDFSLPYLMKGELLAEQGKAIEAIKVLEKSLTIPINFMNYRMMAYSELAEIYFKLGKHKEAVECSWKALELLQSFRIGMRERTFQERMVNVLKNADYSSFDGQQVKRVVFYREIETDRELIKEITGFKKGVIFSNNKLELAKERLYKYNTHADIIIGVRPLAKDGIEISFFIEEGHGLYLSTSELGFRAFDSFLNKRINLSYYNLLGKLVNINGIYGFGESKERLLTVNYPFLLNDTPLKSGLTMGTIDKANEYRDGISYSTHNQLLQFSKSLVLQPGLNLTGKFALFKEEVLEASSNSGLSGSKEYIQLGLSLTRKSQDKNGFRKTNLNGVLLQDNKLSKKYWSLETKYNESIFLSNKSRLYLRGRAGICAPETPANHHFKLGGIESFSAYSLNSLHGDRYLALGLELKREINDYLLLAGLADVGQVWKPGEEFRFNQPLTSLGSVLRFNPQLGINLELYYAIDLLNDNQNFGIGFTNRF